VNSEDWLEATELEVATDEVAIDEVAIDELVAIELLVFTDELVAVDVTELELVFTLLELDETAQFACTP